MVGGSAIVSNRSFGEPNTFHFLALQAPRPSESSSDPPSSWLTRKEKECGGLWGAFESPLLEILYITSVTFIDLNLFTWPYLMAKEPGKYTQAQWLRHMGLVAVRHVGSSWTRKIEPMSPTLAGGFFTTEPPGKPLFSLFKKTVYYNVLTAFMSIYESDFLLSDTAIMLSS